MSATCVRVTGKAFEPHYWELPAERQGPQRAEKEPHPSRRHRFAIVNHPETVYDVLCGDRARYVVLPEHEAPSDTIVRCCARCLSAVVDQVAAQSGQSVVVTQEA